jgi:ubiquinone/menaquinone biosynthesis C-methylase UbiE
MEIIVKENRKRDEAEQIYHEGEDRKRDASGLLRWVYSSRVFDEAEAHIWTLLGDIEGQDALDYGCGTGETTISLCTRGAHVVALDISNPRLNEAKSRVSGCPRGECTWFVQGSAQELPFADASFDLVLGKQILHHLDLDTAISEVSRVLRPGGRAVFLEPLIHNPLIHGYRLLTPHFRSPTEKALNYSDLHCIASQFRTIAHKEFIFLALVPVLVSYLFGRSQRYVGAMRRLQLIDRSLTRRASWFGRFYWETVIELGK